MSNFDQLPFGGGISLGKKPGNIVGNAAWASLACVNSFLNALVIAGAGALQISLQQAKDAAGTGAKALNLKRIHRKTDVGVGNIKDVFVPNTVVTNEAPVASLDTTGSAATDSEIVLVRIRPADLDKENGFCWVRVVVAGAGGAAGCVLYLPEDPTYMGSTTLGVLNQ